MKNYSLTLKYKVFYKRDIERLISYWQGTMQDVGGEITNIKIEEKFLRSKLLIKCHIDEEDIDYVKKCYFSFC